MDEHVKQFTALVDERFEDCIAQLAAAIAQNDPQAVCKNGKAMGSEGLIYSQQDIMKYAITCHNKHISLHLMPIYCYSEIHAKYKRLIKAGKFQKGCVNFTDIDDLPMADIGKMIAECAAMPYPTQYQLDRKPK